MPVKFWTNSSVLGFAGDRDPEEAVVERAQEMALEAMSEGWDGPPYDPFQLAERLGVPVIARDDLYDARTVPGRGDRLVLEYNPSRPRGRVRYSIAHELAHMLFPDAHERVRYRSDPSGVHGDDWQLEMLCNIAAGELLMPAGTFPELTSEALDIENLMLLRGKYDVSTEALLLRVARLSGQAATMFAASRVNPDAVAGPLRIDYWRGTRAWTAKLRRGGRIRKGSAAYDCTAVGFTARGDEAWTEEGEMHVEAVGIPAYPGQSLPRVVGLLRPRTQVAVPPQRQIEYVTGDATHPRGTGLRMIAHVVNNRTANWGGGFARALKDVHTSAQDGFRRWAAESKERLPLGNVHFSHVEHDLVIATMVAQRGYGPSRGKRLRYDALNTALGKVAAFASEHQAVVHMPRIGAGMAGGDWRVIEELIATTLVAHGVEVIVYSLPGEDWRPRGEQQLTL